MAEFHNLMETAERFLNDEQCDAMLRSCEPSMQTIWGFGKMRFSSLCICSIQVKDAACVAYGCLAHWAVQRKLQLFPLRPKLHETCMHVVLNMCIYYTQFFFACSLRDFKRWSTLQMLNASQLHLELVRMCVCVWTVFFFSARSEPSDDAYI